MRKIQFDYSYQYIISLENLLEAWKEFVQGKKSRGDVQMFERDLMSNIFALHAELTKKEYKHSSYTAFTISDPKPRHIHKATVGDRLLHHAIYRVLYPFFDRVFIADAFSCRKEKGTHRALNRFRSCAYKVSKNHTRTCWVLKGDIKKCFASVDQEILLGILKQYIPDADIIWLLERVIHSFSDMSGVGLPLGNLTSQLFINVYMNELDQFIKHTMRAKFYIRYADDFAVLSEDRKLLESLIPQISDFLYDKLHLTLHPQKLFIKTFASGVDFLGWVHFPDHRVLRTATRHRMMRRLKEHPEGATLQSYLGLLSHGNTFEICKKILRVTRE